MNRLSASAEENKIKESRHEVILEWLLARIGPELDQNQRLQNQVGTGWAGLHSPSSTSSKALVRMLPATLMA